MSDLGIMDIWRDMNPTCKDYTYYSSPHSIYSRIDYFLMYNKDRYRVEKCDIGVIDLSDHSPVYLTLCMSKDSKTTLWRLNVNIGHMKEEIIKEIQTYVVENDNGEVSPSVLWDGCKAVLRGKIIKLAERVNQEIKKKKKEINDIYTQEIQKNYIIHEAKILRSRR